MNILWSLLLIDCLVMSSVSFVVYIMKLKQEVKMLHVHARTNDYKTKKNVLKAKRVYTNLKSIGKCYGKQRAWLNVCLASVFKVRHCSSARGTVSQSRKYIFKPT